MAPFNSGLSLVVISDTGRARQIPVPFDGIVLGRDAGLGPPFSTDEFVSRNHVSVQRRGDSVEIADLGSANGTYVNGTRVHAPARLQDSDVLRIGEIELKLAAPGGPDQTMTAVEAARAAKAVPYLTVVTPDAFSGRQFQLPRDQQVVGRAPVCDICLDDPHVSRTHAALRRRGDAVYVEDLGSSSGTFVNGEVVTAVRELHPGDIVSFAGVSARLSSPGEAAVAPAEAALAETGAVSYHIDGQRGEIINNVGRDQIQHIIQQRENFLREIAATKTKARWLIWTGLVSFVAGSAIFAAGVLGFLKQVSGAVNTGTQPSGLNPFGHTIHGIPSGLIGWAMGALGMLLIIIGIVLHIVATSRRRRVDRELPAGPWRTA